MPTPEYTDAFLAHVFRPSKNPAPKGIRQTTLKPLKGRRLSRVNAWNKLSGVKQEVIRRSGKRDQYLSGDITYTDAKRTLREHAVVRGIVKPLRGTSQHEQVDAYNRIITLAQERPVTERERPITPGKVARNVMAMSPKQRRRLLDNVKTYGSLKKEGSKKPEEDKFWAGPDTWTGEEINLLWYH